MAIVKSITLSNMIIAYVAVMEKGLPVSFTTEEGVDWTHVTPGTNYPLRVESAGHVLEFVDDNNEKQLFSQWALDNGKTGSIFFEFVQPGDDGQAELDRLYDEAPAGIVPSTEWSLGAEREAHLNELKENLHEFCQQNQIPCFMMFITDTSEDREGGYKTIQTGDSFGHGSKSIKTLHLLSERHMGGSQDPVQSMLQRLMGGGD